MVFPTRIYLWKYFHSEIFIVLPTLYPKFILKTNQTGLVYIIWPLHVSRRTLPIIHCTLKNEPCSLLFYFIIINQRALYLPLLTYLEFFFYNQLPMVLWIKHLYSDYAHRRRICRISSTFTVSKSNSIEPK